MSKTRWTALVLLLAVAAWIGARSLRPPPAPRLATAPAVLADIEDTVIATGTLESSQLVSVGAQASGQIKSLQVELGQHVQQGQLIAEIDATTQRNTVRTAEAVVTSTLAQQKAQQATLTQTELNFKRQKALLDQDAATRETFEAAQAAYDTARAQMEATNAQLEQAQSSLDTAKANLGYTQILAPISGTVVAIVAREGQTVNAVQSSPTIVKLAKLDTITVRAGISEADVVRVKPGQTVYFTTLGDSHKRYYGKLRTIAPAPSSIEQDNGGGGGNSSGNSSQAVYYNATFEVPNPDGTLRIAMTAQVYVVLAEAKHVVTIPASALGDQAPDGSYTIQVADAQGHARPRRIKVGINNNINAQVTSGLAAGERVVVGMAMPGASPSNSGAFIIGP
ncbi:MAG TPA: efflux RND transporter periplasmic adaptor subunit [Steroidobacteraceae bacterium]|nr:efflux RND transporter periplasmic adaptor subunit [Steroidobacteraceae bacterium]